MNLLLLNTSDSGGGAAIATYRLHRGLRSIGLSSRMLVLQKGTDDPTVIPPVPLKSRLKFRIANFYAERDDKVSRDSLAGGKNLFSPARCPDRVEHRIGTLNPDIIHLFWINHGFLKVESLGQFNRPIVWTLHDMWPFTGGCHYDDECGGFLQSCGKCPVLNSSSEQDLSRSVWLRKQRSWNAVPIVVVATSHWLAEMARSSSLFKDQRIEVIPNGIDTAKYKPLDKRAARDAFALPQDKHLVLFSAFGATTDKRKGNHLLTPALRKLAQAGWGENTELVILGTSASETPPELGLKTHYMGNFRDEISQVLLYSAVDVTVAPSMQENLSNTVVESLSCGTPVVAFHIGGMPDLIDHEQSGYLAKPFEVDDLTNGIMWVLEDNVRHQAISNNARNSAVKKYSIKTVANQYHALYQDILARTPN
ncbi:MAG: glycosyltransferase family 4 protein [Verrucomicrobiota bacterium]